MNPGSLHLTPLDSLLYLLALSGYFTAWAGYTGYLILHRDIYHRLGHAFFIAALVFHSGLIVSRAAETGVFPLQDLRDAVCFAAWAAALVYVLFHARYKLLVVGALVGPVIFISMAVYPFIAIRTYDHPDILNSLWTIFHVLAIFLGNGAFVLAAAVGAAYLLQERAIKSKRHGFLYRRLPSLDVLDRMGYACVAFGFPLLTIGLAAGFVYAQRIWGHWWSWDPKEVWSAVTWFTYAALLHERVFVGWRGRKAAWLSIAGLALALATFVFGSLLFSGHHGQFTRF
ncbi:MAG: cytochrome c biogenesis protein CcsA [Thermodesulfobacteriota bacterium]